MEVAHGRFGEDNIYIMVLSSGRKDGDGGLRVDATGSGGGRDISGGSCDREQPSQPTAVAVAVPPKVIFKEAAVAELSHRSNLNRGGVYPQSDTVQNLGVKILEAGFSMEEANHEGVVVQEVPAEKRLPHLAVLAASPQ